jgi:hypothetical protein
MQSQTRYLLWMCGGFSVVTLSAVLTAYHHYWVALGILVVVFVPYSYLAARDFQRMQKGLTSDKRTS